MTVLVLLQLVAFLRHKALSEKQKRVQAEAERKAIEELSRAKSLFLANISHELRTPLISISGFADLLQEAPELSGNSKKSLERIQTNAADLMEKVTKILHLTESDFSQLQMHVASLNLRQLTDGQIKHIEDDAAKKDIILNVKVNEPFVDNLIGDAGNIAQVLHNILSNAVKFTQKGEIAMTLSTKADAEGVVLVTIVVRDTGIGIERANFERVFDPFRQAQDGPTRPFGGVGLGLTIARKLARSMGGDVVIADSAPGRGTTILITLKATKNAATH
jgi:signal transduction histidine kinase